MTLGPDASVDALILALIAGDRQASADELARIARHVATAPFASRPVRVTRWLKEQLVGCQVTLTAARLPSVDLHLLKRVYVEQQWPAGTSAAEYLSDLHRAVQHPDVAIWTYRYYGEPMIGFLAPSHRQDAPSPEPYILVTYNPRYGTIITGYQVSGPEKIFEHGFEQVRRQR